MCGEFVSISVFLLTSLWPWDKRLALTPVEFPKAISLC
jgi:hypothetical protein